MHHTHHQNRPMVKSAIAAVTHRSIINDRNVVCFIRRNIPMQKMGERKNTKMHEIKRKSRNEKGNILFFIV